jgi:hypothetical protein
VRALLVLSALLAAAAIFLALAFRADRPRLAPSGAAAPEAAPDPGNDPEPLEACDTVRLATAAGAVTALLRASDGALWIGVSGAGLERAEPGEAPRPVGEAGLAPGERMVNALAEQDGLVWAATDAGAIAWDGERRVVTLLAGSEVYALVRAHGALLAGTARGVHALSIGDGAEDLRIVGPLGEPFAATALAAGARTLWIGTAGGAYSIALSTLEAPLLFRAARWHPLAAGPDGATGVVTAVAALPGPDDGAVAGTDGAGLLRLRPAGPAAAVRLAEAAANVATAVAAAPGADADLVGTSAGLLVVRAGEALSIGRPAGIESIVLTALSARGGEVLAGTIDGAVLAVRCASLEASPSSPRG